MSASAQCLSRSAQPGGCQHCSIKGLTLLALYSRCCSGSQQTLDLLVLGKPAMRNSSRSPLLLCVLYIDWNWTSQFIALNRACPSLWLWRHCAHPIRCHFSYLWSHSCQCNLGHQEAEPVDPSHESDCNVMLQMLNAVEDLKLQVDRTCFLRSIWRVSTPRILLRGLLSPRNTPTMVVNACLGDASDAKLGHAIRAIESERCGTPPTWLLFGHCTNFD